MLQDNPPHPILSTILLNWNRSDLLKRTLDSYIATVDVSFELFIVDNGSSDDSRAVIEQFCARCPHAIPILLEENRGGEALNLGIQRAHGVYLHLCENDIEFLPGWLSHVLALFNAFDDLGQLSLFPPVPSDEEVWVVQSSVLRHSCGKIVYEAHGNVGTTSVLRREAWGEDSRVKTISSSGGFRFPDDVGISDSVRGNGYFVAWADKRLVKNVGHSHTEFEERHEYYRRNYESKAWLGVEGWEQRIADFKGRPKPRRRSLLFPGRQLLPEKSEPNEECQTPFLWSMIDGWTAEAETLEFLYALVRLVKPGVCVETGAWHGHAAAAIGRALRENGVGVLYTVEFDAETAEVARRRLQHARLSDRVTLIQGSSLDFDPPPGIDFLLLDSTLEIRGEEFLRFLPKINKGAIVVFHNTGPHHKVVREAIKNSCPSIAYTYSEPITFYEYTLDTSKLAHQAGLSNILVSAGYIYEKPLRELCQHIDAANIDLKSFKDSIYLKLNAGKLQPILDGLKIFHEEGVWLEITNLIIPGWTDDFDMIKEMCDWLYDNDLYNYPLHFSRFQPLYKLTQLPPTPLSTLEKAREIAMDAGIKFVYIGNVPGTKATNTYCPKCHKLLIERRGFSILANHIKSGHCAYCNEPIPGVW